MQQNLVELIEKVQNQKDSGYVEFKPKDSKLKTVIYDEGDLTKSYVKFVSDLFQGKFGKINERTIRSFGPTLKTSVDQFKDSYLSKKSSIKEVAPSVFIHTSMDSNTMKLKMMVVAESVDYFPEFPENKK